MKAAIFDIDGTLIDSVDFHAQAWQRAFDHFGIEIPFERIRSQIGKGGDQLMPVFLSKEQMEQQSEAIEEHRGEIFKKEYLPRVKSFPMVRELFQRLLDENWKLALASSAKKDELGTYKKICRIDDLIDTETSSDDAEESKPHPDIFQAAIKRLKNVTPGDCVVVGDSPFDAEAATKAKIRSVGVLCGGFSDKNLREAGCEVIYRDATDLLARFEDSIFFQERPRS